MGSVKDLTVLKTPTAFEAGVGNFTFSDRYSVFDWGEMPDHLANKGEALCLIGAFFFEKLEEVGVKSHYLGLVENSDVRRLQELTGPVDTMQVKLLRVIKPRLLDNKYDYSMYKNGLSNFLVPLEVIFRNSLPQGSSVFKRLQSGDLKLADLGLKSMPQHGQKLENPILDVSTKLESTDRYIDWNEAKDIAGINTHELDLIRKATNRVNQLITQEVEKMGLYHEDGKIEFGIDTECKLMLVDVLGTPDECRFTYNGIPASKEAAREFYRTTSWYADVEKAKKQGLSDWRKLVSSTPPQLPVKFNQLLSRVYMAFCNQLTGRDWFDTPPVQEVLSDLKDALHSFDSSAPA